MSQAGDPHVQWHLGEELRCLLVTGTLPIDQWQKDGSATVVKDGPYRTVYRVRLPSIDFHLKEYRAIGLRNRTRELLRSSKARAEHETALALAARGIPVPESLGWGLLGSALAPRVGFVFVRTVQDAVHLTQAGDNLPAKRRQQLARELGRFFARLHSAGVTHGDIHPGNILVAWVGDQPRLTLLDLHGVHRGRPLSHHARRANLAVFNRYYILRAARADRLRFWSAYASEAGAGVMDHAGMTPAGLEEETMRSNQVLWRSREAKFAGPSRAVCQVAGTTATGIAVRELPDDARQAICNSPDNCWTGAMLKEGGRSTVGITPWGVLKRFNIRGTGDIIKNWLRPAPERHAWRMGHALLDAGLPTPRPLAAISKPRRGTGYLLTDTLHDVVDLHAFVDASASMPADVRCRAFRERAVALGRTLRMFHDRGFGHRDMKAGNLLTPTSLDDHRIWFVDLAGVRRRSRNSRKRRVRDLARLFTSFLNHPMISNSDRLRVLQAYRGPGTRAKAGCARWWREIGEAGNEIASGILRRGRPVG
jgi:tRNA A-37 threonylcarbamoyl transferase component Bud32